MNKEESTAKLQKLEDCIRMTYTGKNMGTIAHNNNISRAYLGGVIGRMGLSSPKRRRGYTTKDIIRLGKYAEKYSPKDISRKMRKPVQTIYRWAHKNDISFLTSRYEWYTLKEVCCILAKGTRWVREQIECGNLKASYHHGNVPDGKGMDWWHIERKDLADFIIRFRYEFCGRNVDFIQIIDILTDSHNGNHYNGVHKENDNGKRKSSDL